VTVDELKRGILIINLKMPKIKELLNGNYFMAVISNHPDTGEILECYSNTFELKSHLRYSAHQRIEDKKESKAFYVQYDFVANNMNQEFRSSRLARTQIANYAMTGEYLHWPCIYLGPLKNCTTGMRLIFHLVKLSPTQEQQYRIMEARMELEKAQVEAQELEVQLEAQDELEAQDQVQEMEDQELEAQEMEDQELEELEAQEMEDQEFEELEAQELDVQEMGTQDQVQEMEAQDQVQELEAQEDQTQDQVQEMGTQNQAQDQVQELEAQDAQVTPPLTEEIVAQCVPHFMTKEIKDLDTEFQRVMKQLEAEYELHDFDVMDLFGINEVETLCVNLNSGNNTDLK